MASHTLDLFKSAKEVKYQRTAMYEAMRVQGNPARVYSLHSDNSVAYDMYDDIVDKEKSYAGHVDTWITFEEDPHMKTLKSLGWYIDSEEMPIVAYMPYLYADRQGRYSSYLPQIDDRVELDANPYDGDRSCKRCFLIKEFKGNGFPSTIYYTIKLVPYREDH